MKSSSSNSKKNKLKKQKKKRQEKTTVVRDDELHTPADELTLEQSEIENERSIDDQSEDVDATKSDNEVSNNNNNNNKNSPVTTTSLNEAQITTGPSVEKDEPDIITETSFESLGVCEALVEACDNLGWKSATRIQEKVLRDALNGRDIIGLAETGSGKTGAFCIPVLQALLENPIRGAVFGVVLAPTRELAFQIHTVVEGLGTTMGATSLCIVGGVPVTQQSIALGRNPHIIVATPGRLLDHLTNTKGFNLNNLQYLVLDEADRMLSLDFEQELNELLQVIPEKRKTLLFSATMTSKVQKLQRACLKDPVKVEVSTKFQTPKKITAILPIHSR